jgi:lipopolysaccharide/colanic/teichoic acid biosynthesis glycosyltransferase
MQNLKEISDVEKYLKTTSVASYHSEAVIGPSRRTSQTISQSKDGLNLLRREMRYFFGEYAISNAVFIAFLAKAKTPSPAVTQTGPTTTSRVQFAFNWVCALVGLICLLPLFGLVGIAIKLDSSGPVFFKQERVGINRRRRVRRESPDSLLVSRRERDDRRVENSYGRPFMVYKFRTMVTDAEKRCGPIWATKNDPRVTMVGRFLRKTRIDELPQLLNVLRGEMSMVGPRPERPFFIQKLTTEIDCYTRRLEVLPGITGLAQVEGGYDATVEDVRVKVNYDLQYIRSAGIRKDLVIMIKTISVVLGCKGM